MSAGVVTKAKELFFTYGMKSISMDDLARRAGVSKKTIYREVAHKEELVGRVVDEFLRCHREALRKSSSEAKDAVAELIGMSHLPFDTLASINFNFFYELEKFFPSEWNKILEHKRHVVLPTIRGNLERGIAEGVYRNDLSIEFAAAIRMQQIVTALDPSPFTDRKMNGRQLMNELTDFYLHGIVSPKGNLLRNKYRLHQNENRTIH